MQNEQRHDQQTTWINLGKHSGSAFSRAIRVKKNYLTLTSENNRGGEMKFAEAY
jgi:hypothetical protein